MKRDGGSNKCLLLKKSSYYLMTLKGIVSRICLVEMLLLDTS